MQIDNITEFCQTIGCFYELNEPMHNHTSFKIGGKVPVFLEPDSISQLKRLLCYFQKEQIPYFIFGKGSNLLVPDEGVEKVALCMGSRFETIALRGENEIYCTAGTDLSKVCYFAYKHGLSGLEFAWGIPASVGGAVYMNAGAYDGEMKDVIVSAFHMDRAGQEGSFTPEQLEMSYRHSVYCGKELCITGALFSLIKKDKEQIKAKMDDLMQRRKEKQPLEYPSAGSTFKRPQGAYAAALIDQCGLKGKRIGGAMVSEKHAGFLVNAGNASCKDMLELIEFVKKTVHEKTGYMLECEVKMI